MDDGPSELVPNKLYSYSVIKFIDVEQIKGHKQLRRPPNQKIKNAFALRILENKATDAAENYKLNLYLENVE